MYMYISIKPVLHLFSLTTRRLSVEIYSPCVCLNFVYVLVVDHSGTRRGMRQVLLGRSDLPAPVVLVAGHYLLAMAHIDGNFVVASGI